MSKYAVNNSMISNGTIEQVNHYYPFGGVYGDLSYNSELQRNKYICKEFDHMHGLDWYDHGARMYDAAEVVWNKMDRLSEKYYHLCPYLYGENNCTTKAIDALNYKQDKSVVPSSNSTILYDLGGSYEYKDKIVSPITLKRKLDDKRII